VVARARRHRRTTADRLQLAASLLRDPVFDAFLTGSAAFEDLPDVVQQLSDGTLDALCHVIEYPFADNRAPGHGAGDSTPTEATR
jgi:hypothetical protein